MPGVDGERGRVMERRSGELVFNGCRGSVWEKEKVPEVNNGDGCTTM